MLLHHLDNLDSKMECMRNLVARDRLAAGDWTSYSSSLERAILKKAKFLDSESPAVAPAAPPAETPAPAAPVAEQPAEPVVVAHIQPAVREKPVTVSVFAEKLQQAWHK